MFTKVLSYCQAQWAEPLTNYDFILIPIPGTKNSTNGSSCGPDYVQDISVSTDLLISSNALPFASFYHFHLLPSNFTNSTISNALFVSIDRVHTIDPSESSIPEYIITSYQIGAIASQYFADPQHPWSCRKDRLHIYKGLIYILELPSLRMDILRDNHDTTLVGHYSITKTIKLIT